MRVFEDIIPACTEKETEENGGPALSSAGLLCDAFAVPLNTGSKDTNGIKYNVSNVRAPRLGVGN